jgi:hypothetical protein
VRVASSCGVEGVLRPVPIVSVTEVIEVIGYRLWRGCSARQTLPPPQRTLATIVLRDVSSDMHPTRGTRIHPKGLRLPFEGDLPPRDTGRIKAPFAGTICSTPFLKPLLFEHRKGFIQPSAWKVLSANFALTEFYEVRTSPVRWRVNCTCAGCKSES